MDLKILHVRNIANVAYYLALEQAYIGNKSRIFDITTNYTNDYTDVSLNLPLTYPKKEIFSRFYKIYGSLIKLLNKEDFDIIHLHDGGIFPLDMDIPLLFNMYGKVVIHWHGSKLRNNGKSYGTKFSDVHIVSTPDLLEYAPEAIWVQNPIKQHGLTKIDRNDGKIIVGHAPTNRYYKGTEHFINAMGILKKQYNNLDFIIIENTPHQETLELLSKCDIVVDNVGFTQKQIGWYGVVTSEVQQMCIPSCAWIKDTKYLDKRSGITSITSDNIIDELSRLIEDEDIRELRGKAGKDYVDRVHNNKNICKQIMRLYGA